MRGQGRFSDWVNAQADQTASERLTFLGVFLTGCLRFPKASLSVVTDGEKFDIFGITGTFHMPTNECPLFSRWEVAGTHAIN